MVHALYGELPEGTKVILLAPLVRQQPGDHGTLLEGLRRDGYTRVEIDGEGVKLEDEIALVATEPHDIDLVIDRLVLKEGARSRLAEGLELAARLGEGVVKVRELGGRAALRPAGEQVAVGAASVGEQVAAEPARTSLHTFSERLGCPDCHMTLPQLTPALFSFNSPQGACPRCAGLGALLEFDPARVVPDPSLSLREGAIAPWAERNAGSHQRKLAALGEAVGFSLDLPWRELNEAHRAMLLYGSGGQTSSFEVERGGKARQNEKAFEGALPNLERRLAELTRKQREGDDDEGVFEELVDALERYMAKRSCPACHGARLRPEALSVHIAGRSIADVSRLSVSEALSFARELDVDGPRAEVAAKLRREIEGRLGFLEGVGVGYLGLERASSTLSGGEAQRVRLATQIGTALMGVLYILDEPSIGLHPRDTARLIETLQRLRDRGNTVLVVEHDEATIRAADHVVDLGPGAGVAGGRVVAQGTVAEIEASDESVTGQFLSGRRRIEVPRKRRRKSRRALRLRGVTTHNLRGVDVDIPLGRLVCVTGVSGSGKSSLIIDTLLPALRRELSKGSVSRRGEGRYERLEGGQWLEKVIAVDQSPIGRTSRSNPATYTGVLPLVRELFAGLPDARLRGWKAGRFSFNIKGGRCEACKGEGRIRIAMHFLPDVFVSCELCGGKRFNDETLRVRYRGLSIADVLELSVSDAREFLQNVPRVREKLDTLLSVGLGYLELGQPANTLSGGEAQRIKLARELSRRAPERTLYVLDEPTTGLHSVDIDLLLGVLMRLVEGGASVVVIEHDLDVIKSADWVIDLGPEGGDGGGEIVGQGTPEQLAKKGKGSHTGRFLRDLLDAYEGKTRAQSQ